MWSFRWLPCCPRSTPHSMGARTLATDRCGPSVARPPPAVAGCRGGGLLSALYTLSDFRGGLAAAVRHVHAGDLHPTERHSTGPAPPCCPWCWCCSHCCSSSLSAGVRSPPSTVAGRLRCCQARRARSAGTVALAGTAGGCRPVPDWLWAFHGRARDSWCNHSGSRLTQVMAGRDRKHRAGRGHRCGLRNAARAADRRVGRPAHRSRGEGRGIHGVRLHALPGVVVGCPLCISA